MAASTGPRMKFAKLDRPFKVAYPVSANVSLNKDTMVMLVAGALVPMAPSTTGLFAGVTEGNHINATGVLGAIPDASILKEGSHAFVYGPGAPTTAVNGVRMYAVDDQTVTPTQPTNGLYVGEGIYDPDPQIVGQGMIRVRIDKAVN